LPTETSSLQRLIRAKRLLPSSGPKRISFAKIFSTDYADFTDSKPV